MQNFRGIATLALVLLCLGSLAFAPTLSAQPSDTEQLTALATASAQAYNDMLVSGSVEQTLRLNPWNKGFRKALGEHVPVISNRRQAMAKSGMRYSSHKTQLTIESTEIDGHFATQYATERVVLVLQIQGSPSEITKYERSHRFTYTKNWDGWQIKSDEVLVPSDPLAKASAPIDIPPMEDDPFGLGALSNRRDLRDRKGLAKATGAYNVTAAVNYALTYVDSPNPSYRFYGDNDCTNFTSQALKAGGWPYDETGDRTLSNTWYYGSFTFTTSYSWAAAHNFNAFFRQSGRGTMAQYFSQLVKGDLVQADFGPSPDGNISHSMIVTKITNGVAMLTYHSGPQTNRSLDDLRAENPGSNWYGLRMSSSYTY